ncbi:hypothetical protein [Streptomyces flaveus]|uniref:hypothetical protein n=1 Tax=Streptomyces flaveus TaxID=66370 RepID=UPI003D9F8AE2
MGAAVVTATLTPEFTPVPASAPASYAADKTDKADKGTGTLTVVKKSTAPSAHKSPTAPVSAGGGGTARLSAVQERAAEGPGTPHTVIGLILAGAAAVAVAVRSVRRGRGR